MAWMAVGAPITGEGTGAPRTEVREWRGNLPEDATLLLFTDGITEATDANGLEFEETGIAAFAQANAALSAADLDDRLLAHVTAFCGANFHDDATLLVIAAN